MKVYSARLSYAFMFSIMLLIIEVAATAILAHPLHLLLQNLGYMAENYLSGAISAAITCLVGLVLYLFIKDKILIPYSFLLLFIYFLLVTALILSEGQMAMVTTLLMPTIGLCSVAGNLLFWGIYYDRKRKSKGRETV